MGIWDDLKDEFSALERRVDNSLELGFTAAKGLSWDLLTEGKSPGEVKREIDRMAKEFERREQQRKYSGR